MEIWNKLEEIEETYKEIENRMADLAVASNPSEMQVLGKKHVELEPLVSAFDEYRKSAREADESRQIIASETDEDIRALAREEIERL
jgi:peptide chain release factor 1